jgi:hypothetical protein
MGLDSDDLEKEHGWARNHATLSRDDKTYVGLEDQ